jgi:thioredoxin-dependent peroxiredoxin
LHQTSLRFRDSYEAVQAAGAVVLGLSPDQPAALKRWQQKENLPFDLLSDPDHAVLAKYGAWGQKSMYGKSYEGVIRSHFIIGPDGKLRDQQLKVSPADSVARAVAFLQDEA